MGAPLETFSLLPLRFSLPEACFVALPPAALPPAALPPVALPPTPSGMPRRLCSRPWARRSACCAPRYRDVPPVDGAEGGRRNLNYSKPEVRDWYAEQQAHFLTDGVDFYWNDEGESFYYAFHWWNEAEVQGQLAFDANHGHPEYTCVYRVRVYGELEQ